VPSSNIRVISFFFASKGNATIFKATEILKSTNPNSPEWIDKLGRTYEILLNGTFIGNKAINKEASALKFSFITINCKMPLNFSRIESVDAVFEKLIAKIFESTQVISFMEFERIILIHHYYTSKYLLNLT
jgi:hypothetical protein